MTLVEIYNNNNILPIQEFADLMNTTPEDIASETEFLYYIYGSKGRKLIHIHHIFTMRWMLNRIIKNIQYSVIPDSIEAANYSELAELLKVRIDKINKIEQGVFNPPRRRGWM
jgi:hypothetical protein